MSGNYKLLGDRNILQSSLSSTKMFCEDERMKREQALGDLIDGGVVFNIFELSTPEHQDPNTLLLLSGENVRFEFLKLTEEATSTDTDSENSLPSNSQKPPLARAVEDSVSLSQE